MSKNKYNPNQKLHHYSKYKNIAANKSWRTNQSLCVHNRHDPKFAINYKSHLLKASNILHYTGPLLEKSAKQHGNNVTKLTNNCQKRHRRSVGQGTVPITPQMIRIAVKELQKRRAYISSSLIANHLRRCYPIENDPNALKEELNEKLNCAVSVGLIARCGDNKYCIPTLRQQANSNKTAVTAFWDTYYGSTIPSTARQFLTLDALKVTANGRSTGVTPKLNCKSKTYHFKGVDCVDS